MSCEGDSGAAEQDTILKRLKLLKSQGYGRWKEDFIGRLGSTLPGGTLGPGASGHGRGEGRGGASGGGEYSELHWECLVSRCEEDIPPVNLAYKDFPIWYPDYELVLSHYRKCHPDLYCLMLLSE